MSRRKDKMLHSHVQPSAFLRPRCVAKVGEESEKYRERATTKRRGSGYYKEPPHNQCAAQSSYSIDGRYMCRRHAGLYLLDQKFPPEG